MTTVMLTKTIAFHRERVESVLHEAKPLLEAHWREIAHYQDIPLEPDWEKYGAMDEKGALRVYTLRNKGQLEGYAVFFVSPHMHYRTSKQANQDIIYLDPMLRNQMIGARFIQWCDEQLQAEGVQAVYHHVKLAYDFGPTLKRLGYEPIETVWGRRLDR